jgi:phosphatidyl-myo-inositol alpha-mannosyltransferase
VNGNRPPVPGEDRLRIALVTEYFYPHLGGVTEHVFNLMREFTRLGHHVTVITSRMGTPDPGADAQVAATPPPGTAVVRRVGTSRQVFNNGSFARFSTGLNLTRRIEHILRQDRIDVVHVQVALVPGLGIAAPQAARRRGIPVVATFHSWFPRQPLLRIFQQPAQQWMDQIAAKIAVSEPAMWAMSRYLDAEWEIIPNGVNISFFHPNGRLPDDAQRRGPRLLFLGRLDPRNGLDTLLGAMPAILERYPRSQLLVAGDGPLRPYYVWRARGLRANVQFLGRVYSERAKCYSSSDLYLCPTTKASFGITLLEAMASGTPVLASDIIGFRELVNGGAEAVLVPAHDPAGWAETTLALIESPQLRVSMGRAGLVKAMTYSWAGIAQRVLKVYEQVAR